jgi:hypothetical protein
MKMRKALMNKDLLAIFEYLEREKGIKREIVIDAIAESLKIAARKSVKGLGEKVSVEINPKTGEIEVFTQKKVVEKVSLPSDEILKMHGRWSLSVKWGNGSKFRSLRKISDGLQLKQQDTSSSKSSKERNGM